MAASGLTQLIQDVLGSAYMLSTAVNDLMEERLHAVTGEQLTFSQVKLLKLISRTEAYNISQVAAFLGVSTAAASKAVDRLVRRGLLHRSEAEEDRRAVQLALTAEGSRLLAAYDAATAEAFAEIFGDFPVENLRQVADLLDHLSVNVLTQNGHEKEVCYRCSIYFREKCLLRSVQGRDCHVYGSLERKRTQGSADGLEPKSS